MTGILVEYARFIEVRQRRAHVLDQLTPPVDTTPGTGRRPSVDDRAIDIDASHVDTSTTHQVVDVR